VKERREFSVSDLVGFGFLAAFFPADVVEAVVTETGRRERRSRLLPSRLVVYYVLAMALYPSEGYRELFRLLVEGLGPLDASLPLEAPVKSAFSKARERVGSEPLKRLFEVSLVPLAAPGAPGAWFSSWRVMSVDGSTLEVADTPENLARFGRPGVSRGERSAYPRLRWVALSEVGTRAVVGLTVGAYGEGETTLARPLLGRLQPGMLCLADRSYFGYALWREALASGADLLWRVKRNALLPVEGRLEDGSYLSRVFASPKARRHGEGGLPVRVIEYALDDPGRPHGEEKYRLVTSILDPKLAPARELAALYAERWQIEITIRELKVTRRRPLPTLRSRKPDGVIQELYGFMNVHYAIRWLLHQASQEANVDPDTLSYLSALRAMRRKLSRPESFSPHDS